MNITTAARMALDALTVIGMNYAISYKHWPKAEAAITALREALAAPPAAPAPAVPASGWVWAHRKGGEYTVFGKGKIQCDAHLDDMADVVIYRSSKDGTLWARPEAEFNERFNRLRPLAAPPAAPVPVAPVPDGWVMVPRKELGDGISLLHQAMVGACDCLTKTHEAKYHAESCFYRRLSEQCDKLEATIAASPAAPVVPLTDTQILSMWKSSEFRGNGGQADWFCEGIRAAEAHHGITGGKK